MKRASTSRKNETKKRATPSVPNVDDFTLTDAIEYFTSERLTANHTSKCIEVIEAVSRTVGLLPEDIDALVEVIDRRELGNNVHKRLINCLIPTTFVPEDAVITAISWVTCSKFSSSLQADIIKWISVIHPYINSTENLSFLYAPIFILLQSQILCPFVCELLYKLTKEEHVTSYRIAYIVNLLSYTKHKADLLRLLKLYSRYKPELVLVHAKYKKKFPSAIGRLPVYVSQVKKAPIPQEINGEDVLFNSKLAVFSELSDVIRKVETDVNIMKILQSPLRRVLLSSLLPEEIIFRLRNFLHASLFTETPWAVSRLSEWPRDFVLPLLSAISSEILEGVPDVFAFIGNYLKTWDGQKFFQPILDLIQYWEICLFCDIFDCVLRPMYKHFCYSSINFKCAVIRCFTNLYKNWVLFESPRFRCSTEGIQTKASKLHATIFDRDRQPFDPEEQIENLAMYISHLCVISLQIHSEHPSVLLHRVLRFYETMLLVHEHCRSTALFVPPALVVCAGIFAFSPAIIMRTCSLICRYKDEVYHTRQVSNEPVVVTSALNSYILDICNMLALSLAFKFKDKTIFFQDKLPSEVASSIYKVGESFAIFRHPALLGASSRFIRKSREELDPEMLLKDWRTRELYLQYISSLGFTDIVTFLRTFVKTMSLLPEERSYRQIL